MLIEFCFCHQQEDINTLLLISVKISLMAGIFKFFIRMFKVADGIVMPAPTTDKLISTSRLPRTSHCFMLLHSECNFQFLPLNKILIWILFHIPRLWTKFPNWGNSAVTGYNRSIIFCRSVYWYWNLIRWNCQTFN